MKLALSILCENPLRRTGLTTTYHEFVARGLKLCPDVSWVVFVGPNQPWRVEDPRVEVVRDFPANDRLKQRLIADHFQVPAAARARGADAMISTGFVPVRKCLPVVMHIFSLQHLDKTNQVGFARACYRNWLMKYSWPKADLIITNSQFAKSQILSVSAAFGDRLVQAYEGLQHEQFNLHAEPDEAEKMRAKFNFPPGYLLWISNFYPYKQAPLLLAAYARLAAATRRAHPLVMVGGDWENELNRCREQVQTLGIATDVKFLGWVGDEWLAPLYRHARAFVLASREETFGRCVIEAMACGTPVVVNDIPIMQEVTAGHAVIVDFEDAAKSADALRQALTDEPLRARLRSDGLRRAQDFTFEKFAGERLQAIRDFLARRKAGQNH